MENRFFETNDYFIDEKVNFLKFENCYNVFNDKGEQIGSVKQKISAWHKILQLLINKAMMPFELGIYNTEGGLESSVSRGWTFWMSKISIKDAQENVVGTVQQKFKFFKPTFRIFNASEKLVALITGDWKAWNFTIKDSSEQEIGSISKKWAGAMKEIFTSADKYHVHLDSKYTDKGSKIAVLSAAITIDMVLKESK